MPYGLRRLGRPSVTPGSRFRHESHAHYTGGMGPAWLRGVFPPIATPFQADGTLGAPVAPFLEHLRDAGLDGVVALGSNGEAAALSDRERIEWIQALRLALPPRLRLLAGTGAESTRQTIERTQAAAAAGAECALVITPSFYRRDLVPADFHDHYTAVAGESPIPILVYNVPQLTGVDLPAEWFLELPAHPRIAGIKDSSGNLDKLARVRQGRPDLVLLPGVGAQLAEAMALGADGAIPALANLAGAGCTAIRRAASGGDESTARRLQAALKPLATWLSGGGAIARLKAGLAELGFDHGLPRAPLRPAAAEERGEIRTLLADAGLLSHAVPRAT